MTPNSNDTIVALGTPLGRSAIAVIRLSGPKSLRIVKGHLTPRRERAWEPRLAYLAGFHSRSGRKLDEILVIWFPAPHSYTGEDVVELSCHGSPAIVEALIAELLSAGARLAEPGEFTLRAFLHGKLDLVQAEAVRDLIESNTRYQFEMAVQQLEGQLSRRLQPLRQELIRISSHLETALEFVEDEVSPDTREELTDSLRGAEEELTQLLRSFHFGRLVREGVQVAICGLPNAGKSSIFNALMEEDRVIVTSRPGTTRDAVGELCEVGGFQVRLVDTAGIREGEDEVERLGVERSHREIGKSDFILCVTDGSEPWGADNDALVELLPGKELILVANKSDLSHRLDWPAALIQRSGAPVVVSALSGKGMQQLRKELATRIGGAWQEELGFEGGLLTNLRQRRCVEECVNSLQEARRGLRAGRSEEFILYDLRKALNRLGELTGEVSLDEILENIFSSFCIGK